MLGACLNEATDIAATGKMLARRAQHDDAGARILVQRFEREA